MLYLIVSYITCLCVWVCVGVGVGVCVRVVDYFTSPDRRAVRSCVDSLFTVMYEGISHIRTIIISCK